MRREERFVDRDETPWARVYLSTELAGPSARYIDLWLAELETDGRAEWTRYQYKKEVARLVELFPSHAPEDFSKLDVQTFKMERGRSVGAASLRRALLAVRSFFSWCEDNEVIAKSPCRKVSLPVLEEREPTFWTAEEVRRLLTVEGLSPRDRLFLNVLARTGQRLTPTRFLTWERIVLDAQQPLIRFGRAKGGKFHTVPMDRSLYRLFKAYRELVQPEPEDYVFASRQRRRRDVAAGRSDAKKHPIGTAQSFRVITEACRRASVPVATAHQFRRSLATKLLSDPNVPFKVVSKDVLNHSNPATTLRHYAGGDYDQVASALRDVW